MAKDMGRGIIAPYNNDNIGTGASEMRTLGATTAAAISDVDVRVTAELAEKLGRTEAYTNLVPRDEAAQYGIEGPRGPEGPPGEGEPGPPGPGGSIALEETDPGCFVDSEITWMQWPQSGGLPAVWNPNTQAYEQPIRVDTSVGTRVFVGDTMIYGDTGWRDISSLVTFPVTNGWVRMRRVGLSVEVLANSLSVETSGSTSIMTLPSGFRPAALIPLETRAYWGSDTVEIGRVNSTGVMQFRALSSGNQMNIHLTFTTQNTWPSTLPGTPA